MAQIKSRKRNTVSIVALAAAMPLTVQAAETEQLAKLPTINSEAAADSYKKDKVSSDKFTQPLVDTTQTVAIIPEKVLREQNATTLTEALRNVPGVGAFSLGENGRMNTGDAVTMRGFDTANSIFIDGVRDLGNVTRDMFNYEQIEVFKGPAGTDNGRTAASGSINLSTKRAQLEDSTNVSMGIGSDDYYRATADLNKKINETTAVRVNLMGENSDGIGRDWVKNEKWAAALSAGFGLGTDLRFFLDYLHVDQDNVNDGGIPTIGLKGFNANNNVNLAPLAGYLNSNKVNTSNYYGAPEDFDDVLADMVTARVEYDLSDKTRINNTTRWGKTEHQYLTTFSGNSFTSVDANNPNLYQVSASNNSGDTENEILTNQTNLITSFNTGSFKHDLSTGVEFTREKMKSFGWNKASSGTSNLFNPQGTVHSTLGTRKPADDTDGQMDTYSAFVFDTIKLSPKFSVNGGVRLDYYELEGFAANHVEFKNDDTLFNWKVGALYKPAENGSLYVNYAVQQQPPGTVTGGDGIGNLNALTAPGNGQIDPQKIKTAEVGTKWEFLNQRLLLTGALFKTEVTNEVEKDGDLYYQTGKKSVEGVELGVIGNLNDNWQITAGYTHQDTKINNLSRVSSNQLVSADGSNEMPFTPTDAFTLWTTYSLDKWSIGSGARYTGEMKKNKDGNTAGPAVLPDYWIIDSMISYQATPNLGVQFNLNNVFDKDYIGSINRGGLRYIPGTERNFRLTLNYKF